MQLLNYRCTSTCPKRQRAWKYSQHQELICGSRIQFCSWKSHKGDLDSQRCCQRVLSLGEFGVDKASLLAGGFQNALSFFFTFLNHIRCAEDALQACFMSPAIDTTMAFQRAAPTKLSGVHKGTSSSIMEISLETEKGTINTIQYIYINTTNRLNRSNRFKCILGMSKFGTVWRWATLDCTSIPRQLDWACLFGHPFAGAECRVPRFQSLTCACSTRATISVVILFRADSLIHLNVFISMTVCVYRQLGMIQYVNLNVESKGV